MGQGGGQERIPSSLQAPSSRKGHSGGARQAGGSPEGQFSSSAFPYFLPSRPFHLLGTRNSAPILGCHEALTPRQPLTPFSLPTLDRRQGPAEDESLGRDRALAPAAPLAVGLLSPGGRGVSH